MATLEEQRRILLERMKAAGGGRVAREEISDLSGRAPAAGVRVRRKAGSAPTKKKWRIPPKVRQYLPYAVIFLAIIAPLLHNPPRNNEVPPYLRGTWHSNTPGYEDRYLLFVERNVAFGTGGYDGEAYMIAEVQAEPVGEIGPDGKSKKTLFTIRYMKPDKLEYTLSFYYEPEPVKTITFKNQENLTWTKKGPES